MNKLWMLGWAAAAIAAHGSTIYNNGPVVDGSGLSILRAPSTTFGFGAQSSQGNTVADDFVVAPGQSWTVESLDFYAYQTGATSFPFVDITWSVVSGALDTGTVIASGTSAAIFGGRAGYRVTGSTRSDTSRGIYAVIVAPPEFSLASGSYWLTWSFTGQPNVLGLWQPPTSDAAAGNAMQSMSGGAFASLIDGGSLSSVALPFTINGTVSAVPDPGTISPVPEPGTLALLLGGNLLIWRVARRRAGAAR